MGEWLVRNLALVNVVLLVLTVMSYVSTMYWLMTLTHLCSTDGALGGVLEYQPFGSVAVFHVTRENLKGRLWLAFPDVTAYLLLALAVVNAVGLGSSLQVRAPESRPVRGLAIRNVLLTAGCLVTYIWGTMLYIARYLSLYPEIGGVVGYAIGFVISVVHVYEGHIESSINTRTYDFTLWLLLLVLISTVTTIRRQLMSISKDEQSPDGEKS
jgi:hypothetical protein